MPATDLTNKAAKRALADAAAGAELKAWNRIVQARDKARKTKSPAPALPELSSKAEKIRRNREFNAPITALRRNEAIERGTSSAHTGMPSASSSAPTTGVYEQREIARRLRETPHLMTPEQNQTLSDMDQYHRNNSSLHYEEKAARLREMATARQRELAVLAMSSCGITPEDAQVQEDDVMCQLEIVRKECEKEGRGCYIGVTQLNYKAVQSQFPERDLTPASMAAPALVEQLNKSIREGKISIDDFSETSFLDGAEWLRSFLGDPEPLLKVCSRVFVLALVLVVHAQKHVPVSGHTSCDTHTNTHSL